MSELNRERVEELAGLIQDAHAELGGCEAESLPAKAAAARMEIEALRRVVARQMCTCGPDSILAADHADECPARPHLAAPYVSCGAIIGVADSDSNSGEPEAK